MKYIIDGAECPNPECGLVFVVKQRPWPYMGELQDYKRPRFCPACGTRIKEGKR